MLRDFALYQANSHHWDKNIRNVGSTWFYHRECRHINRGEGCVLWTVCYWLIYLLSYLNEQVPADTGRAGVVEIAYFSEFYAPVYGDTDSGITGDRTARSGYKHGPPTGCVHRLHAIWPVDIVIHITQVSLTTYRCVCRCLGNRSSYITGSQLTSSVFTDTPYSRTRQKLITHKPLSTEFSISRRLTDYYCLEDVIYRVGFWNSLAC